MLEPSEWSVAMTPTKHEAPTVSRPPAAARAATYLLLFLGATAVGGGSAMALGLGTETTMLPDEWLEAIPFIDSWTVPGIVLAVGFGLGSLLVAYGVARRPRWSWTDPIGHSIGYHWAWLGTLALGAGHALWIALQLVFLPGISPLQVVYGAIGVTLAVLPATAQMRAHLRYKRS
jgi:hypothetical protein